MTRHAQGRISQTAVEEENRRIEAEEGDDSADDNKHPADRLG
jgi:hypothetical protein